jgi:fibronectin-binding autotransporter adhesin
VVNGGTWSIPAGGNMTSASAVTVSNSGTILHVDGSITTTAPVTVNTGATLSGSGSIAGNVLMSGTLSPGNSPGSLTIGGNLSLLAGIYKYEVDSDAPTADLTSAKGDLSIAAGVALAASDLGTSLLAATTKFTLINYGGNWDSGLFTYNSKPLLNNSLITIGPNTYLFRYDDISGGSNFGGGTFVNNANLNHWVTITAVPEASAFLTVGLGGIFAIAAVCMGKRLGVAVLKV